MYIRYSYEGIGRQKLNKLIRPKTNILQGWYTGTYTEIANTKQGHIGKNRFENVIAEFAPKFENLKPLARELRSVLFPIRDRDIFTGTFHNSDIIYDGMIIAFNTAIDRLGKEEQGNLDLFFLGTKGLEKTVRYNDTRDNLII
ncbi:serine threonine- kinase Sgk2 protein [Rutstroemia sp. NJR-2017a WRK4]|nr:serine threonine- kinase Sgk2 protein [Rutstroemia sp. NJR-2017a WRK4]